MRFLDVDNLIHASTKTTCSKKEILEALEGVFFWSTDYLLMIVLSCILDGAMVNLDGDTLKDFGKMERIEVIMCMRAFMLIRFMIKFGHLHSPSMLPYQPLHHRTYPLEITGSQILR